MTEAPMVVQPPVVPWRTRLSKLWDAVKIPALAILSAFVLGAVIIMITSGGPLTVADAYWGMIRGALIKQRGFTETLVAATPYILLSLGVGLGFKTGLFNIGIEGQFFIGAISAAWIGAAFQNLPAIIHLPLTLLAGVIGGAIWAAIPGYLKARTGAHEVISTMMMNYIAFRLQEYIVTYQLKDPGAGLVQTRPVASAAEVWTMYGVPARLQDPLNALMAALVLGGVFVIIGRWLVGLPSWQKRLQTIQQRRLVMWGIGLVATVVFFFGLPALTRLWWPFTDPYDRLHTGLFIALFAAVAIWWLLQKTTLGFELRSVGANINAARYAGMSITRNTMIAMALSGALGGLAGSIEVLGVSTCRCVQVAFVSGYGWDSIGISLLAKNSPFGIIAASLLWAAMRNGADLMELSSGVSKYIISLIQGLVLLFIAAPAIVRWVFRIKAGAKPEEQAPLTRGWGGG
jgi:general nucleoside transport system permease protein